jgi:alpha-amylase/alpha-mannosidase (GH57 family)
MQRFITIHAHFYQPPRENPWLEETELQESVYPYHDWNQRISAECYRPNTASRILDADRKIIDIVNNYSKISFAFGPSLLSWMQKGDPQTYEAILEADRTSRKSFNGHGGAIASCYNHCIMPLATPRDKQTQVLWGIEDFRHRFGRNPEGIWIPELAVDHETLDIIAREGIAFTILSPHQARRIRPKDGDWSNVEAGPLNTHRPYRFMLPGGRSLAVFFFNKQIADNLKQLLDNGGTFAARLVSDFSDDGNPQLVSIASDGEAYGHHHRFGDMALAYCIYQLEKENLAAITVYGDFLDRFPPDCEVEIFEGTSRNCVHGIERWRGDCGCGPPQSPGWSRQWREPLRGAMEWLRDNCDQLYEDMAGRFVVDPWKLRDEYIRIILDRSVALSTALFTAHARIPLCPDDRILLTKLCEMERHAQLMFTSSGWMSEDISDMETIQVLMYAARAIQLAQETGSLHLESPFANLCERAMSNKPHQEHGGHVYRNCVQPAVIDLARIGAHYAISSLFENYADETAVYCYSIRRDNADRTDLGLRKLAAGKAQISSEITGEHTEVLYIVLHMGDHDMLAGLDAPDAEMAFNRLKQDLWSAFGKSDLTTCIHLIEKHFSSRVFTLWHLFKDERRKILRDILGLPLAEVEASFRQMRERYMPLMQAAKQAHMQIPRALQLIGEYIANADLRKALTAAELDIEGLERSVAEIERFSYTVDRVTIGYDAARIVTACLDSIEPNDNDSHCLSAITKLFRVLRPLSLELNLGRAQNRYFTLGKTAYVWMKSRAEQGDGAARQWIERFAKIGDYLHVRIE